MRLELKAPITTWDEGIPIGNGKLGALVWGGQNGKINISIDRGDLWDLRPAPELAEPGWNWKNMQALVKAGNASEIGRLFDACYEQHPNPTKLPVARLEIQAPLFENIRSFHLDLGGAYADVLSDDVDGLSFRAIAAAQDPVILIRIRTPDVQFKLRQPAAESGALKSLLYPPGSIQTATDRITLQQANTAGQSFAVVCGWKYADDFTTIAISVSGLHQGQKGLDEANAAVNRAIRNGSEGIEKRHESYWKQFWSQSSIDIPDEKLQRHANLVRYFYGSASRPGSPPIPLQGVWTADNGGMPPWKGDYHHDLNTQTTYIAYPTTGHFDEGRVFLDFMFAQLPRYRQFAKEFYDVKGAVVPGVATLDGSPMGGWGMYSLSPTNTAWIAHLFYRHWRYTDDTKFLKERALPWCSEVGGALDALLVPGPNQQWVLPLSSSPEINDNRLSAFLTPNSGYDEAMLISLFQNLVTMAKAADQPKAAERWQQALNKVMPWGSTPLAEVPLNKTTGELLIAQDLPYKESHRHFSHLMPLHPLGLFDIENSAHRKIANASVNNTLKYGTNYWVGYSFSWMACHLARLRRGDEALEFLSTFEKAFLLRNGFHCNGDQIGGFSEFRYRPFTLEGNFLALEAISEMLLQSWDGRIAVFPAMPKAWKNASFHQLRAEGGFTVSAEWKEGALSHLKIEGKRAGQECVVRWPGPVPTDVPGHLLSMFEIKVKLNRNRSFEFKVK